MSHPELALALRSLAHEEFEAGRASLLAIVAAEPDNADAWAYLSGVHLAFADAVAAQDASERALAADPDGFAPRLKAGELALRLGDLDTAERWFLAALRSVEPGTPGALAAKRALVITRTKSRASIRHGASLPRMRSPLGWWHRRRAHVEVAR